MEEILDEKKKNWTNYTIKSLAFWVVVAIVSGVVFGMINPTMAILSKPGIDWFIQALKWLVGPIIFLTIILYFGFFNVIQRDINPDIF